ncbi:hypothetical protein JCGZ_09717 [Jatropha curcas]|uniref:Uncharacterized protein n=1 Tax=Jatropha curcas TaxID=180498 RepID=A0A067LDZ3_JATCU|nr:hypothetical protein JCGZ_09717 [Jatropha curcas]
MEAKEEKASSTNNGDAINYRGVKAMPFIIGNETFEKLGTIGTLSNLLVYLTHVFNMKNLTATLLINIFNGTSNVAPLVGAFLSDSYFGRYKILAFSSICSFLGMTTITLTAAIPKLHPPNCVAKDYTCAGPTTWQLVFLLSGFGFIVLGAGGIRPCNLAFGADQFNPATESGKQGVQSFFNWYYFTFTFAVMISASFIVYVQVTPEGSPMTSVVQVVAAAIRKRRLKLPHNPDMCLFNYISSNSLNSRLLHTDQFGWLDKAAIISPEDEIDSNGSSTNPWKLCSIQQVEEAKCVVRVIPIWLSGIIYFLAIIQQHTFVVLQALQSDRRLGNKGFQIPAASFVIFTMLGLTIWIPVYDRILVPFLRKLTKNEVGITLLQRMGIGLVLSILCMLTSALVEQRRKYLAFTKIPLGVTHKGLLISAMSAFWFVPQLTLAGLTEAFSSIGQTEFYYNQFPENMRSIAMSLFFLCIAFSSYLSGFLISLVHHITKRTKGGDWLHEDLNKGKLDHFYYIIAGLGVVNLCYFLVISKWYRYKGSNESTSEKYDEN